MAFESDASNLVQGDTNGRQDVFVRDRKTNALSRVNRGPGGVQAIDGDSFDPAFSADGRFVAFFSDASNLVPGDTNDARDVFVRDRQTGTTRRVSVEPGGVQGNEHQLRPGDLGGRALRRLRLGRQQPGAGRHQRRRCDVFVRDRQTGTTRRVSVGPGGVQGNDFSGEIRRSRRTGASSPSTRTPPTWCRATPTAVDDVFVRDRQTGTTQRVSVGPGGAQGNCLQRSARRSRRTGASSPSSRTPATWCRATPTARDVFVRDRQTGTTRRVSVGPGGVQGQGFTGNGKALGISANGRVVAISSEFTNLVPGDTNSLDDLFVHSR